MYEGTTQLKNEFKSVIFDLDGTLLYTLSDIARALNIVLSRYGYPIHEEKEYRAIVGGGLYNTTKNALPENARSEEIVGPIARDFAEEYRNNPVVHTSPYPGIPTLLDTLSDMGVMLCILSNKKDEITREVVQSTLDRWSFFDVRGQTEDVPRKPDPAGVRLQLEKCALDSNEVILIGDSAIDMEAACKAGVYPAGVLWGYGDREEIEGAGSQILFSRPEEILTFFSGSRK